MYKDTEHKSSKLQSSIYVYPTTIQLHSYGNLTSDLKGIIKNIIPFLVSQKTTLVLVEQQSNCTHNVTRPLT